MFLLNANMIESNRSPGGLLDIRPFLPEALGASYYYFHLGPQYRKWNDTMGDWDIGELSEGKNVLELGPNEYCLIQSLEYFRCSKQCLAIFGVSSSLVRRGYSLRNSPFIDPNYPDPEKGGYLELGLRSEISKPKPLKLGEVIGKVCFFNITDTYPIRDVENAFTKADYSRRATGGGPSPIYDDHPAPGWKDIEEYGRKQRRED